MNETTDTPETLDFQARNREGDEECIKELFTQMNPAGMQWVAHATPAFEQASREIDPGLGSRAISKLHAVLKSTEHSLYSGVSIDGGGLVAPPISVTALRAIVEYHLEKHGTSDLAWKHFTNAVRVDHMAQKILGKAPAFTKGSGSGSDCTVLALAPGVISIVVTAGVLVFA